MDEPKERTVITLLARARRIMCSRHRDLVLARRRARAETALYTVSHLARIHGFNARPLVFDTLVRAGVIGKDKTYYITPKGFDIGGRYKNGEKGERWTIWPEAALLPYLLELKARFVESLSISQLYHITHIENLVGILSRGILSHGNDYQNVDISDGEVNARRARSEPIYKRRLHEYATLYVNPRNAMLYRVQRTYGDDVIILAIDKTAIVNSEFVFSNMNAASDHASFINDLQKLCRVDWSPTFRKSWAEGGSVDSRAKSIMMAECLINSSVPPEHIRSVRCLSQDAMKRVTRILSKHQTLDITTAVDTGLFF